MCTVAADYAATASTVADHVPRTGANAAADQYRASVGVVDVARCSIWHGFIFAVQSLLDKAGAVLKEIGAELAAGSGEGVEGIEVEILSQLGDDASWMIPNQYPMQLR